MVRRSRSRRLSGVPHRRLRMGLQKGSLGVGLIARCLLVSFSFFLLSSKLIAAPQLRLSQTAVGPLSVAAGASTTAPSVDASNIGDGSLNLSLSSSAQWLVPTLGQPRECSLRDQTCTPIEIALRTSALAAGIYTGTITVA